MDADKRKIARIFNLRVMICDFDENLSSDLLIQCFFYISRRPVGRESVRRIWVLNALIFVVNYAESKSIKIFL